MKRCNAFTIYASIIIFVFIKYIYLILNNNNALLIYLVNQLHGDEMNSNWEFNYGPFAEWKLKCCGTFIKYLLLINVNFKIDLKDK